MQGFTYICCIGPALRTTFNGRENTFARADYHRRHAEFSGEDTRVVGHRITREITVLASLSQGDFRSLYERAPVCRAGA